MNDFAQRFHLKYPEKGFEIAPWDPEDAKIYFGKSALNLQLQNRIEAGYSQGRPPKLYLQGSWGSGKTHHLYHIQHILNSSGVGGMNGFITPYIAIECQDNTDFHYFHKKLLNGLTLTKVKEAVSDFLMDTGQDRTTAQQDMFGSRNLILATQVLAMGGENDQLAWKWMSGDRLNPGELKGLGVTTNLEDTSELTDVLIRLGRLFLRSGKRLIFFIDEAESVKNVSKPNAQSSWHDGLKNLADNANNSVGYMIAIFMDNNNPTPEFMIEDDIVRRMGQKNIIDLEPFFEGLQLKNFIKDLLSARIDFTEITAFPDGSSLDTYPFKSDAFDLFLNELLGGAVSATPSKIIEGVRECTWRAHELDIDLVSVEVVQEIMPVVTQAT